MPEWEGFLLCGGIVCAMLLVVFLCLSLSDCGLANKKQDVCVLDEWYEDIYDLSRYRADNRLTQIEGAELDYDFGIELQGLYITQGDRHYSVHMEHGLLRTMWVYCGDILYVYDRNSNTLWGQDKDAEALRELTDIYFASAEVKGNKASAFTAENPGKWTYIQSDEPAMDASKALDPYTASVESSTVEQ